MAKHSIVTPVIAVHEVDDYSNDHHASAPSLPADVPADCFSIDDDDTICLDASICFVATVVDCCFVQSNELSWFLGAMLIHWNNSIVA